MNLKELRKQKGLTQKQAATLCGVSLRSYKDYENNPDKYASLKYTAMVEQLSRFGFTDETHGILTQTAIRSVCSDVLKDFPDTCCYLFGSYAKGTATESSDVDLLLVGDVGGLRFYGLAEKLRLGLRKKVDLLDLQQLQGNPELLTEILREGLKIYG